MSFILFFIVITTLEGTKHELMALTRPSQESSPKMHVTLHAQAMLPVRYDVRPRIKMSRTDSQRSSHNYCHFLTGCAVATGAARYARALLNTRTTDALWGARKANE